MKFEIRAKRLFRGVEKGAREKERKRTSHKVDPLSAILFQSESSLSIRIGKLLSAPFGEENCFPTVKK